MNGADTLVQTLLAGGVNTCFANPGTSEIHIVAALDRAPALRCVLGLFEGVATGAADGYARMAEKPACTLLHLGPGLANGLANLHNAYRARVAIINVVGQHATYHLHHDAPLTSDIEGIGRPYSKWLRTASSSRIGRDAAEAVVGARTAPGQIATLIVPADVAWGEGTAVDPPLPVLSPAMPSSEVIDHGAVMLRSGLPTAILLSGKALYGSGLREAGRIAAATGAKLLTPYPFTRFQRGAGIPPVDRIAYILEQAQDQLKEFRQFILVGASAPVAYFAYPGKDSVLTPADCEIHTLARPEQDLVGALSALAEALAIGSGPPSSPSQRQDPELPTGEITLPGVSSVIGGLIPENAILVEESMTSGRGLMPATRSSPPHDWLGNTGGSIGIALPLAVGAAVAAPDRRVLCLTADGSAMYTLQALWTMAREGLKVTTVVFANRTYAVLKREFSYLGVGEPGPKANEMFEIGRPDLDWVQLAKGMGVPGTRVTSLDALGKALEQGFASDGPALIEIPL